MAATLELIAVSIPQDHPTGTRRRAGFMFTTQPTVALVTPEQKAIIKEDSYMRVHRRLSQSWFSAMGIERTAENEELFATEDPENWAENANIAPRTDDVETDLKALPVVSDDALEGQEAELKEQEAQDDTKKEPKKDVNDKKPLTKNSKKADIIKALEEKGKVAGTDFDPAATNAALLAVYEGA